jgi:hypothetical protein
MAQLGSKAPEYASVDDDPNVMNFTTAMPWIGCWMCFLPQKY